MRLFIMEFKHLMFSKTFLFYCLLIIIFTVLNCQQVLKHPINSDVYQPQNMTMYSTDKNIIMSNEIKELKRRSKKDMKELSLPWEARLAREGQTLPVFKKNQRS